MQTQSRGFTLIELLLALAIFAYAATAILNVLSQSARNLSDIEQITFASWVANDLLVELQVDKTWPPKDKEKGEREMAGQLWYWQRTVTKAEDKDLRLVTFSIRQDKASKTDIYSLSSFISKSEGKL